MLLNVSGLKFGYTATSSVLNGLSFAIGEGEIVGLLGPNGSGKSTLIRCITDLLEIRGGEITIDSHPHRSIAAKNAAILLANNDDLPEFLTGIEFVELVHRMYQQETDAELVGRLFDRYAMGHREHSLIEDYSHGMRKKIQLITALSLRPRLTIIDETLNGVDLDSLYRAEDDIRGLAKSGSVLVCSHDFRFLEAIVDRVIIMESGELVHDSPLGLIRNTHGSVDALARQVLREAGAWA